MARACVLIVSFQSEQHLPRAWAALEAQTYRDFEVVLIDNASAVAPAPPPGVRFVRNPQNIGFAAANNQGAATTQAEFLVLLNPDAFPEPDWLAALVAAADQWPEAAAFGSTQLMDDDPDRLDGAGDVYHATGIPYRGGYGQKRPARLPEGECFAPCAAAALYRRAAFLEVGGFPAHFFAYGEDVDLGFRLRLAGWTCRQVPEAVVRHVGSASSGRKSAFAMRHGVRNRMWVFARCMPGLWLWLLAPAHLAASLVLWVKAWADGAGPAYGRGLWEGLCGLPAALRQRADIQRACAAPTSAILRAMSWSPLTLARRAIVIRRPEARNGARR
jgi:N-acetylglucosaminyl-diphospho-decaprenol L-rhamnosyltransferase